MSREFVDNLKNLHYWLVDRAKIGAYREIGDKLSELVESDSDINVLKIALIAVRHWRTTLEIREAYDRMQNLFDTKFSQLS